MTNLEKQTLADGFMVCLLETWQDRPQAAIAFQAKLFDGGREVGSVRHVGRSADSAAPVAELLKLIYRVLRPPHILAVYGLGWLELLQKSKPEILRELRILDLHRTAVALSPSLRAGSTTSQIATAYRVEQHEGESLFFSETIERILWAVVAAAGARSMTWSELLHAADAAREHADFTGRAFDRTTLDALPESPGVYTMYDKAGAVIYIGKSANLRRRLGEYFEPSVRPPPKITEIRQRIQRFDCRIVGSELEALLVEDRLIRENAPAINVQMKIAEGRSRYAAPLLPVVIMERSSREGHADLFFLGGRGRAMQVNANTRGATSATLSKVIAYYAGTGDRPRPNRVLTDWGPRGQEIAHRYFARHRDRLHWMEVSPASCKPDWAANLLALARKMIEAPPPAGEYRDDEPM